SVDGARAHDVPDVEPGFALRGLCRALELALPRHLRGRCGDGRVAPGDRRPRRRDVPRVRPEREVSLVPGLYRLRPPLAVAGHDLVRPRRELRARSEERRVGKECRYWEWGES